jgi:hypothetical protein
MTALLKALLILGLVALNAFFVAAEYALLSVRRTRLEELVKEGESRARSVLTLLADVRLLFSGIQLGITVSSLLMGALGETIMARAIEGLLEGYLHKYVALTVAHSIAVGFAFLLITTLLMVLGELVPKAMAYDRAEQASLFVARPMLLFLQLSKYPVRALDAMASAVLRVLRHLDGHPIDSLLLQQRLHLCRSIRCEVSEFLGRLPAEVSAGEQNLPYPVLFGGGYRFGRQHIYNCFLEAGGGIGNILHLALLHQPEQGCLQTAEAKIKSFRFRFCKPECSRIS